jgi:hypothetical protein
VTFAVDVVFCVPTLEAGSTAGHVLRKPVAQWNSLQQASTLKVGESHIWLDKIRQFQENPPFIRSERPQCQLRRPIADLDDAWIFHLFDVFVILRLHHRVECQLRVLIFDLERTGVDAYLNVLLGKPLCWLHGRSVLKYEGKEQCGKPCPFCGERGKT